MLGRREILVVVLTLLFFVQQDVLKAAVGPPLTKVTPSVPQPSDEFGFSVSLSGKALLVGAPRRVRNSTQTGEAFVFQSQPSEAWSQTAALAPNDLSDGDEFGSSVAISDDTAIVSARRDDDRGEVAGSAYILQRDHGGPASWGQVKKLYASDAAGFDIFGDAVAISGDTAVVGAFGKDGHGGDRSGAVYIFERNHGGPDAWGEVAKLTPSNPTGFNTFGTSVAISDDTIIVGASADDNRGDMIGSAYIYQRDAERPGGWREVSRIRPSDSSPLNKFGGSVSIFGTTALIGAFWDNDKGNRAGAAYVFEQDQQNTDIWSEVAKLTAADGAAEDWFGNSVAISDEFGVVGSLQDDDQGPYSGSAYVFQRNAGGLNNWGQVNKVIGEDVVGFNFFGNSVAISNNLAVVGAYDDGPNGDGPGKAYVFLVPEPSTLLLCCVPAFGIIGRRSLWR
jgi:FG-GAP repeat